ncbi:MAG: hypothetical protein IMF07_05790 [Proteobacteria bacterium]|nr:hypothetical protein [Pseudomonadota bacterium]
MNQIKIFYSWQSDHPNSTNRGFIQKALENAIKKIQLETLQTEVIIDRDTKDVPGSPNVADTIFSKIEQADIFVCDISIVNPGAKRPTINSNVLLELGYALKAVTPERIIMVINTAFGDPKTLPFDLLSKRYAPYHLAKKPATEFLRKSMSEKMMMRTEKFFSKFKVASPNARIIERNKLAKTLEGAIQLILREVTFSTIRNKTWPLDGKALAVEGRKALEVGDYKKAKEVFFVLVSLSDNVRHELFLRKQTPMQTATPFQHAMELLHSIMLDDFSAFYDILHDCRKHALIGYEPSTALNNYEMIPDRSLNVLSGVLCACCIYTEPSEKQWAEKMIIETLSKILVGIGFALLQRGIKLPEPTTQIVIDLSTQRTITKNQPPEHLLLIRFINRVARFPEDLFQHAISNIKYAQFFNEERILVDPKVGIELDEALNHIKSWAVIPYYAITTPLFLKNEHDRNECLKQVKHNDTFGSQAVSQIRNILIAERECLFRVK